MKSMYKFLLLSVITGSGAAYAQDILTGDTKLACEAILCLSTGARPGECGPSIAKYRSIKHKKYKDTINARRNFLALCPTKSSDPQLASLLDTHAHAEQYCDPWYLNWKGTGHPGIAWAENGLDGKLANVGFGAGMAPPGWMPNPIPNVLPPECQALANHPYTFEAAPKYVGTPELYGYWTTWEDWPAKNAQYQAAIPAMLAQKQAELDALNSSQP
jgi:hypothetical protein